MKILSETINKAKSQSESDKDLEQSKSLNNEEVKPSFKYFDTSLSELELSKRSTKKELNYCQSRNKKSTKTKAKELSDSPQDLSKCFNQY